MTPHDSEKLERLIHRTLRSLPDRRAPHTLETRVLAALAGRAALPWWRQSYTHWPLAARGAFLLVSAGVVKIVLLAVVWAMAGFDTAQFTQVFAPQFAWIQTVAAIAGGITNFLDVMLRSIPPLWLYGGAAVVAAFYVALFGLGATAYRTLYADR